MGLNVKDRFFFPRGDKDVANYNEKWNSLDCFLDESRFLLGNVF
jgi:hypothetical protein